MEHQYYIMGENFSQEISKTTSVHSACTVGLQWLLAWLHPDKMRNLSELISTSMLHCNCYNIDAYFNLLQHPKHIFSSPSQNTCGMKPISCRHTLHRVEWLHPHPHTRTWWVTPQCHWWSKLCFIELATEHALRYGSSGQCTTYQALGPDRYTTTVQTDRAAYCNHYEVTCSLRPISRALL